MGGRLRKWSPRVSNRFHLTIFLRNGGSQAQSEKIFHQISLKTRKQSCDSAWPSSLFPRMELQTKLNIEIQSPTTGDWEEIELEIFGEFIPAERGSRGHYGEPLEPDWPATVEVREALYDGVRFELDSRETERAERALWDAIPDREED